MGRLSQRHTVMIFDALLAFAIVMASATQLTLPFMDMTFGEIGLGLWIVLAIGRQIASPRFALSPALARISIFWMLLALALSIGTIVGYFKEVLFAKYLVHDAMAYTLMALFTFLSIARPDAASHYRQTAWFLILFANLALALQLAMGLGLFGAVFANLWYWNRFQGWSTNPNQFALYCAVYGPVALHLATTSRRRLSSALAVAGLVIPVYAGLLTKSDTFLIILIVAGLILIGLELRRWLAASSPVSRQLLQLTAFGGLALAVSVLPLTSGGLESVKSLGKGLAREKGSLSTEEAAGRRLALLHEAVEKGLSSMSLGLGPGPHLQVRPATEPFYSANRFEAHNSYLDLYTQGGLAAVLSLIWIYGTAALFAFRARQSALVALVVTVALFSIPHLVVRHPIVWFAISLPLTAGRSAVPDASVRKQSFNQMIFVNGE